MALSRPQRSRCWGTAATTRCDLERIRDVGGQVWTHEDITLTQWLEHWLQAVLPMTARWKTVSGSATGQSARGGRVRDLPRYIVGVAQANGNHGRPVAHPDAPPPSRAHTMASEPQWGHMRLNACRLNPRRLPMPAPDTLVRCSALPVNRARRLLGDGKTPSIIVPLDDSLIAGPSGGLSNMDKTMSSIAQGRPNAVLAFPGQFQRFGHLFASGDVGWIMNITASLAGDHHLDKRAIASVQRACQLGADGVAAHVNVTSGREPAMIEVLGRTIEAAAREGLLSLAIVYPRRSAQDGTDDNYDSLRIDNQETYTALVSRCVRLAADLGADIVKTRFTGSVSSFRTVVEQNQQVPVFVAGGPLMEEKVALDLARQALAGGALGLSFGRNVFHRSNPGSFIQKLRQISDAAQA